MPGLYVEPGLGRYAVGDMLKIFLLDFDHRNNDIVRVGKYLKVACRLLLVWVRHCRVFRFSNVYTVCIQCDC